MIGFARSARIGKPPPPRIVIVNEWNALGAIILLRSGKAGHIEETAPLDHVKKRRSKREVKRSAAPARLIGPIVFLRGASNVLSHREVMPLLRFSLPQIHRIEQNIFNNFRRKMFDR